MILSGLSFIHVSVLNPFLKSCTEIEYLYGKSHFPIAFHLNLEWLFMEKKMVAQILFVRILAFTSGKNLPLQKAKSLHFILYKLHVSVYREFMTIVFFQLLDS